MLQYVRRQDINDASDMRKTGFFNSYILANFIGEV